MLCHFQVHTIKLRPPMDGAQGFAADFDKTSKGKSSKSMKSGKSFVKNKAPERTPLQRFLHGLKAVPKVTLTGREKMREGDRESGSLLHAWMVLH